MLAITIVSVALTSTIALAAIIANVVQQREGFRHDRGMADRDAVRDALAEASAVMHRAEYAIDAVSAALLGFGSTMFDPDHPERAQPQSELEAVGRELDKALGRLRILLGPRSSVTLAAEDANTALLDGFRAVGLIRLEGPDGEGRRANRIADRNDELVDRVQQARENFKIAQEQFVERAHAAVGADLPGDHAM